MATDADARSIVLRRYCQHLIELVLLSVAAVLSLVLGVLLSLPLLELGLTPKFFSVLPMAAVVVVSLLGVLWIEIWYPHRHGGSTPAMRWLGLRITTLHGGEPSLRDYFVRWLLMAVDGLLLGLVGAVLIAVTPRNQRLGDMVAGTVVVRLPAPGRPVT
ncbi:RDD family protein [Lentzea sp. E54]|uniref:RDD family protein n=1 Tax=Lentzea xerophila TaxID=3435883 RepID=UPI003DA33001